MKTNKRGVYATPDFDVEVINVEAGFALSLGSEGFGSYEEEEL